MAQTIESRRIITSWLIVSITIISTFLVVIPNVPAVQGATSSVIPPNLIKNSGFENWTGSNIDDWTGDSGLIRVARIQGGLDGTYCAQITVNSSKPGTVRGIHQEQLLADMSLSVGDTVSFSAGIMSLVSPSTITSMMVRMDFFNGTYYVSRRTGTLSLTTSWQVVSCSSVIPDGVDRIQFYVNAQSTSITVGNADFVVDRAVAIESGTGQVIPSLPTPEMTLDEILSIIAIVCSVSAILLVTLHIFGKVGGKG
jgi:hypothetical protein